MDNHKYKEEEIEEDIQIEENEKSDEKNNRKKSEPKIEETEEIEDDLMYEDEYESVKDDLMKSISMISSHKDSLSLKYIQIKNKNKLNKLTLLLSQKFLNIIYSILSSHIRQISKIFFNNMKSLIIYKYNMINLSSHKKQQKYLVQKNAKQKIKNNIYTPRIQSAKIISANNINNKLYKVPKYYIESQRKQEERKIKKEMIKKHYEENKKKKINEEKKKEKEYKTNTEIEYERYKYQKKLEKYNEQERKKYMDYLIRKNTYADNIYKFIKKKQFFANLKFNLEIRKVVYLFLTNINNKMTKINGLKTMKKVSAFLEEKRLKKEKLDNIRAENLYKKNLKKNFVLFLTKYNNVEREKDWEIKNKLVLFKKKIIFNLFRKAYNYEFLETKDKKDIITKNHLYYIKKKMFYILIHFVKEKRDEKIKEDLISKLKNKAHELLKDYE
jgi:hypothetical protein